MPTVTLYLSSYGFECAVPEGAFPLYALNYQAQLAWASDAALAGGVAHSHSLLPALRLKRFVRKGEIRPSEVEIWVWSGPEGGWTYMELDEDGDFYDELPYFWQENDAGELSYREIFHFG